MKSLKKRSLLFILALSLYPINLRAETVSAHSVASHDDHAKATVNRMAEFLSLAQRFTVTVDAGFDAVQKSGQKIEFGERRVITLSRPSHLYIEGTSRSDEQTRLFFDGQNITLFHNLENVYAVEPKAGTVDEMVEYFVHNLGTRLPLAEMLSTKLAKAIQERAREVAFVEESLINGVWCDHIVLRGDHADMQLWIANEGEPLPQRVVISYKNEKGEPQFWAQFSGWNFTPEISDSMFTFSPPVGAAKIAFATRSSMKIGEEKTAEGDKQ